MVGGLCLKNVAPDAQTIALQVTIVAQVFFCSKHVNVNKNIRLPGNCENQNLGNRKNLLLFLSASFSQCLSPRGDAASAHRSAYRRTSPRNAKCSEERKSSICTEGLPLENIISKSNNIWMFPSFFNSISF